MTRTLALLLALLAISRPAAADMYPDASNAKLPEAAANLGVQVNVRHYGAHGDGTNHPATAEQQATGPCLLDARKPSAEAQMMVFRSRYHA